MRLALAFIFFAGLVLLFQNCGSQHASYSSSSVFDMTAQYPFSSKATYFSDVQLIKVSDVQGGINYQFNAAVSYADNPDTPFLVRLRFLDEKQAIVCPPYSSTIDRTTNAIEITDCLSLTARSKIMVYVDAKLPADADYTLVNSYEFTPGY